MSERIALVLFVHGTSPFVCLAAWIGSDVRVAWLAGMTAALPARILGKIILLAKTVLRAI
jgi:hypothetical protein